MSQAMWRSSSLSGRPRLSRWRGIARPAWSPVRKNSEAPVGRNTRTGAGSASPSRRVGPSDIRSVNLGVTSANGGLAQPLDDAQLGPLEAQVDIEKRVAEPLSRRSAGRQTIERLVQRARQGAHARRLALGFAHVPETALGRGR